MEALEVAALQQACASDRILKSTGSGASGTVTQMIAQQAALWATEDIKWQFDDTVVRGKQYRSLDRLDDTAAPWCFIPCVVFDDRAAVAYMVKILRASSGGLLLAGKDLHFEVWHTAGTVEKPPQLWVTCRSTDVFLCDFYDAREIFVGPPENLVFPPVCIMCRC